MKKSWGFLALVFIISALVSSGQTPCFAQRDGDEIAIGTYQVVHSRILDEDRLLFIHLPQDYQDTQLAYPVLYLLYVDVYNYFADAASITERLGSTGEIPPLIIVGVANTDRYRDLLPAKKRDRDEGGGAGNFLRFFDEELIPHIDRTLRTKDFRILAGPQAGAVFSLYALITKPELFDAVISENPFMNPDNAEYLYPLAEQFFKNTESLQRFLYITCEKNERPQDLEYAGRLAELLESDAPEGLRFTMDLREPSGYFITPLPFAEGLRALFAGHALPENFRAGGVADIIDYYETVSGGLGFAVDPPSHMLTFQGVNLGRQGKMAEAVGLFEYQLSLYPKSLDALMQLAEIHRRRGELEQARRYYRTFLDIRDTDVAMVHSRLGMVERMIERSAAYRIEQEIKKNGIQAGLAAYRAIRADADTALYFDESEFNALGYRLLGAGKMADALTIFKLNVELHPGSANAHDSLAESYMKIEDTENAIHHYTKSLELNPANDNAKEMLERLKNR